MALAIDASVLIDTPDYTVDGLLADGGGVPVGLVGVSTPAELLTLVSPSSDVPAAVRAGVVVPMQRSALVVPSTRVASFLVTENGDFVVTENGDRIIVSTGAGTRVAVVSPHQAVN